MKQKIFHILAGLIFILILSQPANSADSDYAEIVPHAEYESGALHRFYFGDTWRDLWTTPIRVPLLDMDTFAGGLTPIGRAPDAQTVSLLLESRNGIIYNFRSLEKFTRGFLPEDLDKSLVDDVTKEIFSTTHPAGPLIMAPILKAAGVLNPDVKLFVLPDNPRLGSFRSEFAGMAGTLEIYPDESNASGRFAAADSILRSYPMLRLCERDNAFRPDAITYLKARLIDVFTGDWDRHINQWRWAFRGDSILPIPHDRDQAFCRYDGLLPWAITIYSKQVESCDNDYPSIENLTWSGRHLDRKILSGIGRRTWDSVTNRVISQLSDDIIIRAVRAMPREMFAISGAELISRLIARRNSLGEASSDFYEILAENVDIQGSNKSERCDITRYEDGRVEINLFDKQSDSRFFHRIFIPDETEDVRINFKGGDDYINISGRSATPAIGVHVICGAGRDSIRDESRITGAAWGFLPFDSWKTQTWIYDNESGKSVIPGNSAKF
ncbi:MAG: hypothetical protein ACLFQX_09875, partial [Candidatus Kapaibacterium sp.]